MSESAEDYDLAIMDHQWCMDNNVVARIVFRDGKYRCEYTAAKLKGWHYFRQ